MSFISSFGSDSLMWGHHYLSRQMLSLPHVGAQHSMSSTATTPPPGMDAFLIPFRPRPHGELTPRSSACSPPPSPNSFILNCLGRMEGASQFLSSGTTASLDARSGLLINKSQLHFDLHYSWGIWSKIGHVGNKRFKVIKYSVIRTVSK